jgi:hypothetical protein
MKKTVLEATGVNLTFVDWFYIGTITPYPVCF